MRGYYERPIAMSLGDGRLDLIASKAHLPSSISFVNYISQEGDTAESLSFEFYGRSDLYHLICLINNVDKPFYIEEGTNLLIPHPDDIL